MALSPMPSYAQERLWLIDKLVDDKALYNTAVRFALTGSLDVEALQRALSEIVARHEALRTGFSAADGRPDVSAEVTLPFTVEDLRDCTDPDEALRRHQRETAARPFDLRHPPLLRAALYRLADERRELLIAVHHIVFDGASADVLMQELESLYPAFLVGRAPSLPPLALQPGDLARRERERADADGFRQSLSYWSEQLGDDLPLLTLPSDRTRPPRQTYNGASVSRRLSVDTGRNLDAFCRRERVTPFMTMLAAYAVTLCRHANQQDVVIGSPFALRGDKDTQGLIGFFVNTVALRLKIAGSPTFRELLHSARRTCLEAFRHADCPFGEVVAALQADRDPSHSPVFQAMLVVQGRRREVTLGDGLRMAYLGELAMERARFDVALVLDFLPDGAALSLEYNRDLFDSANAQGLLDRFCVLLDAALADPDCCVDRLPLTTATERTQLLRWASHPAQVPDGGVHALFERVARRQPDAVAVSHGAAQLTYRELDQQAERIADYFHAIGVVPGARIALCLPRIPHFLAAVLACWKVGAAYVPLDPELPEARHRYMAGDAGVAHVVTTSALAERFSGLHVTCVDDAATLTRIGESPRRQQAAIDDGNRIAYVIYTSGSTGEPKGVLVPHRAVARLFADPGPLGYGADTVMLQSVNAAFDASVLETWAPLCCGGRLVLYPGQSPDVSMLRDLITANGVNTLTLPAALLDMWVEQLSGPTGLRRIVAGGEALSATTVGRLYGLDAEVTVVNHYGPTENGILTSYYPIPRGCPSPIPIGHPVPGTGLLVLNEAGQLQPTGAVGELFVTGQGLAQGYLDRPEQTAERFVTLEIEGETVRAYRTGDLVRWQRAGDGDDALLAFMGRSDQQVKIRGFRIELGEIEARLRACPGVQDARVLVRRGAGGDRQIVAYVIDDGCHDRIEWRAQLQEALPGYMVPAAFVRLAAWPLTQNGKADLQALPAPERDDHVVLPVVPPATALEARLLSIWQSLLRIDRISVEDDFFDIGGHSLLATRLHNRVRAELGVDVPLRALFQEPTIRRFAAYLESQENEPSRAVLPPVTVAAHADDAPLSYAQQRLWFIHQFESDSAQYHIPYRLQLRGGLDIDALRTALHALIERHSVLATVFCNEGSEPRQRQKSFNSLELPVDDVSAEPPEECIAIAQLLLAREATRPFDLTNEPPLRARLVRLATDEHWLALTVHHIAADGWAMGILQQELGVLYAAARRGETASLPPLPVQYRDYAYWQRRWLDETALEPQYTFWQQRLEGLPLLHNLPLDRPRPQLQTYRGALHVQSLPRSLVDALQHLGKRHDATLFMVLHAAFALLLSRYSGETDIVVGTPVANRRDEALASLVGLFINTLVLRTDLSATPTFIDLLQHCRDYALDAYEHQDLPFELLVERLNPARSSAYTPLFQVLFALQNNEMEHLRLDGTECEPIPLAERFAKFDLALNLQVEGDVLRAEWEYNPDLFDAGTIGQMARCYATLLEAVVASPHSPIQRLPLLSDAERREVLELGNATARPYPQTLCVHTLFERQAASRPDAIAVIHEESRTSYAALNAEANRLARHLIASGVGRDVPVAIAMERGAGLIVGLLAILKAGGAYVPLDAGYPQARLAAMLDDCAPRVVLTDPATLPALESALDAAALASAPRVLDLHTDATAWAAESDANLPEPVDASHLAYVIYTSGSTGRPKGVGNEHQGIVNRLLWLQEAHPLATDDRFLQTAPLGFGASVVEIFWPLTAGAQLVLTSGDGHKDPDYLVRVIQRERIGALHFVPSMLQAFLDHPQAGDCRSLARILCGGEALHGSLARRCRERLPQAALHHLYGSSETAVLSTGWDCTRVPIPDNVPIGTPGANTRIYILDACGEPVPRGVRGEIHVAGRQVARGYLHRPELDAERFSTDPFHSDGARMYRTGDLARHLPDGSIEHLGRNDFQVKIRGQRVELGDIEAQMIAAPGIRQAVVVARDRGDGMSLAAYVVPDEMPSPEEALLEDLRRHLKAQLPAHMVPAAYCVLPRLPLNANGKLDREALPVPGVIAGTSGLQPPEDDVQRQLHGIWVELLKHDRFGVDCDFFAVGGHSLLALRVVNRIREVLAHELELKAFFTAPTIRAIAEGIHRQRIARRAAERFRQSDLDEITEF
ncbi:amino acid adenylation domain-containing protein [Lysobacter yangpyeongensis]|uniref:Amino acid adenylation domain-containing protein n=2 Tax=Lysobacter yangpyeongensis TaxID=346182 RepID=A0ABW0SJE0_9GAMM